MFLVCVNDEEKKRMRNTFLKIISFGYEFCVLKVSVTKYNKKISCF
jgi:hypothetical protein